MARMPLSPRLARFADDAARAEGADCSAVHSLLIDAGVLTYLAVTKIFPSSAEAEQAAADRGAQVRAALKVLWDTAEEEEGKYLEACAHVRRVARSHLPVARETHFKPTWGKPMACLQRTTAHQAVGGLTARQAGEDSNQRTVRTRRRRNEARACSPQGVGAAP